MQPKVTVVIPVYNQEDFISACLDAVLAQDIKDIEVLCINDGSTDQSLKILKEYEQVDPRLTIIDQNNQGVAKARNIGIEKALGEYIIFLDPDDYYPNSEILSKLYNAAVNNNALISAGSFSIFDEEKNEIISEFSDLLYGYTFHEEGFVSYFDYQFDYGFMRFLFKTDFLRRNGFSFPCYKRFQDPPFLVQVLNAAEKFYAITDIVYCYRLGHQSFQWSIDRQLALLSGLADNLKFSKENNLAKLHLLTLMRLEQEYGGVFYWAIEEPEIFSALVNINALIDTDLIPEEYLSSGMISNSYLISPLRQQISNGEKWRQDISDLQAAVLSERKDKEIAWEKLDKVRKCLPVKIALRLKSSFSSKF